MTDITGENIDVRDIDISRSKNYELFENFSYDEDVFLSGFILHAYGFLKNSTVVDQHCNLDDLGTLKQLVEKYHRIVPHVIRVMDDYVKLCDKDHMEIPVSGPVVGFDESVLVIGFRQSYFGFIVNSLLRVIFNKENNYDNIVTSFIQRHMSLIYKPSEIALCYIAYWLRSRGNKQIEEETFETVDTNLLSFSTFNYSSPLEELSIDEGFVLSQLIMSIFSSLKFLEDKRLSCMHLSVFQAIVNEHKSLIPHIREQLNKYLEKWADFFSYNTHREYSSDGMHEFTHRTFVQITCHVLNKVDKPVDVLYADINNETYKKVMARIKVPSEIQLCYIAYCLKYMARIKGRKRQVAIYAELINAKAEALRRELIGHVRLNGVAGLIDEIYDEMVSKYGEHGGAPGGLSNEKVGTLVTTAFVDMCQKHKTEKGW